MILDMLKVTNAKGKVSSITAPNGKIMGVVTIAAEGFDRLVGYCSPKGTWVWVKKDFRK